MSNNLAAVAAQLQAGLGAALERAASGELESTIADAQAERGQELLEEEFAAKTAPSGAPWAAPKRDYGHPLLRDTGDLESSGTCEVSYVDVNGHELRFAFTDYKAIFHQFGTKVAPNRRQSRALAVLAAVSADPEMGSHAQRIIAKKQKAAWSRRDWKMPPRPIVPNSGEEGRWRDDLDIVGQATVDRWLESNVRI